MEAIIIASGHEAVAPIDAEFLLADLLHPVRDLPALPTVGLASSNTALSSIETLGCPLRPWQLLQWLRQRQHAVAPTLAHGWRLNPAARTLTCNGATDIALTEKEAALLAALLAVAPQPMAREALLSSVWGISSDIDTHTLETHIYRLRSKLAELTPPPGDILTEDGAYRLITNLAQK
jgi:hypothetical protein